MFICCLFGWFVGCLVVLFVFVFICFVLVSFRLLGCLAYFPLFPFSLVEDLGILPKRPDNMKDLEVGVSV